jgi:hypothetical protein
MVFRENFIELKNYFAVRIEYLINAVLAHMWTSCYLLCLPMKWMFFSFSEYLHGRVSCCLLHYTSEVKSFLNAQRLSMTIFWNIAQFSSVELDRRFRGEITRSSISEVSNLLLFTTVRTSNLTHKNWQLNLLSSMSVVFYDISTN